MTTTPPPALRATSPRSGEDMSCSHLPSGAGEGICESCASHAGGAEVLPTWAPPPALRATSSASGEDKL